MLWSLISISNSMSFQTPFTCELEYWKHLFIRRWHFFSRKSKSEGEIIGNNADVVLNDFYGLGQQKYLNNVWRIISLDSSDDAILILQNTKITTSNVPGFVASANKNQTTYENIYHSCLIVRVNIVLGVLECTCTFLSWKLLFEFFKWLVSALVYIRFCILEDLLSYL